MLRLFELAAGQERALNAVVGWYSKQLDESILYRKNGKFEARKPRVSLIPPPLPPRHAC